MLSRSTIFDLSLLTLSGCYYLSDPEESFIDAPLQGASVFSIVSIFDRIIKESFFKKVQPKEIPQEQRFSAVLTDPVLEELVYSGIFLTQSKYWTPLRFAFALVTGMTAARTFIKKDPKKGNKEFTLDTKIGCIWAFCREAIVLSTPNSFLPLNLLDSCVFSLAELCPTKKELKENPNLPNFDQGSYHKMISSFFFRLSANAVARTHGLAASITQHVLFNFSRSLQNPATFSEKTV